MSSTPTAQARLRLALMVGAVVFGVQVAGGLVAHSLALYANAGHLASDLGSIGLAYAAARWDANPPNRRHSYGYRRGSIVAALLNSAFLVVLGGGLVVLGVAAAIRPKPVADRTVLITAGIAFLLNLAVSAVLHAHRHDDLNVRGVFWHVFGDALGSGAVVAAAGAIALTGWRGWDGLAAAAVGSLMLVGSWGVGRGALDILMEATPAHLDGAAVQAAMESVTGVDEVHHLHIWALAPNYYALSAHLRVSADRLQEAEETLSRVQALLAERFSIGHTTLQVETPDHQDRREWDR